MIFRGQRRLSPVIAVLTGVLAISGCQSMSGSRPAAIDIDKAMPGEIARARNAHMLDAIKALDEALSSKIARLDGIPLDAALHRELPLVSVVGGDTSEDRLQRLAESDLIAAGPYRLVQADTLNGRLEYRSEHSGAYLSVTVRAPDNQEQDDGQRFVVTDMFSQVSLAELPLVKPRDTMRNVYDTSVGVPGILIVKHLAVHDDRSQLDYFNSLPTVERDREDLLGLRAMLMMRLGQDRQAASLVEQGIVRYPDSPLYFTLASLLFERADHAGGSLPESLSMIMRYRFKQHEIRDNRRSVEQFLSNAVTL